jgi:hypothetical protein
LPFIRIFSRWRLAINALGHSQASGLWQSQLAMFYFQTALGVGPLRIGKNLVRHPEELAEYREAQ